MNGHLGVKSGPLAPTSCKLSKQMLVLQQMNAHYKKLQNVKSSIDMSTPKTLSTSVKSRDRMRRQHPGGKNPNSRPTSSRPSSRASNTGDHFSSNQAYADDPLVDEIVREALQDDLRLQLDSARGPRSPYAPKASPAGTRRALYDSARSSGNRRPESAMAGTGPERLERARAEAEAEAAAGGDVLDRHKERFTAARPFQPRVLRKNVPSKLSQFRYYNKPKPGGRRASAPMTGTPAGGDQTEPGWAGGQPEGPREAAVEEADPDKVRWLMQQAESARFREGMNTNTGHRMNDDTIGLGPESGSTYERIQAREEEELKYLQFYSDVTDDVLNRGIFTNKVLNQVFQHHLDRNKHGLRISKMREILQNIRSELGIPEDDRLDDTFGFGAAGHQPEDAFSRPTPAPRVDLRESRTAAARVDLGDSGPAARVNLGDSGPAAPVSYLSNSEVEESHLAICQVRPNAEDGYEVTDLASDPAPGEPAWRPTEAPMDVTPPRPMGPLLTRPEAAERREERVEGDEELLLTTQDETDLAQMQETLRSAIERRASLESLDGNDVTDASPEKRAEPAERKVGLDDSTYSLVTNGDARSLSSTTQSDDGAPNFMTTTLRPGEFGTMMQTVPLQPPRRGAGGLPPLARTRMGKSVTFASQDEVLADSTRAESDAEGATLTEVSVASSSLEMGSLRRSLPSDASTGEAEAAANSAAAAAAASTDYEEDFEDDDAF